MKRLKKTGVKCMSSTVPKAQAAVTAASSAAEAEAIRQSLLRAEATEARSDSKIPGSSPTAFTGDSYFRGDEVGDAEADLVGAFPAPIHEISLLLAGKPKPGTTDLGATGLTADSQAAGERHGAEVRVALSSLVFDGTGSATHALPAGTSGTVYRAGDDEGSAYFRRKGLVSGLYGAPKVYVSSASCAEAIPQYTAIGLFRMPDVQFEMALRTHFNVSTMHELFNQSSTTRVIPDCLKLEQLSLLLIAATRMLIGDKPVRGISHAGATETEALPQLTLEAASALWISFLKERIGDKPVRKHIGDIPARDLIEDSGTAAGGSGTLDIFSLEEALSYLLKAAREYVQDMPSQEKAHSCLPTPSDTFTLAEAADLLSIPVLDALAKFQLPFVFRNYTHTGYIGARTETETTAEETSDFPMDLSHQELATLLAIRQLIGDRPVRDRVGAIGDRPVRKAAGDGDIEDLAEEAATFFGDSLDTPLSEHPGISVKAATMKHHLSDRPTRGIFNLPSASAIVSPAKALQDAARLNVETRRAVYERIGDRPVRGIATAVLTSPDAAASHSLTHDESTPALATSAAGTCELIGDRPVRGPTRDAIAASLASQGAILHTLAHDEGDKSVPELMTSAAGTCELIGDKPVRGPTRDAIAALIASPDATPHFFTHDEDIEDTAALTTSASRARQPIGDGPIAKAAALLFATPDRAVDIAESFGYVAAFVTTQEMTYLLSERAKIGDKPSRSRERPLRRDITDGVSTLALTAPTGMPSLGELPHPLLAQVAGAAAEAQSAEDSNY